MRNISELPDELLLRILSFVPTKDIVAASLVSKVWRSLRTKVSRLTYEAPYYPDKATGFLRFLKESLLSHQPHALETLYIDVKQCSLGVDIRPWIKTNVICNLRELEVDAGGGYLRLPSLLFTCKKLVVLKLKGRIQVKLPSTVCLPSLKTLHLLRLTLLKDKPIHKILSNCPLLYDLRLEHDVMSKLHIAMPSLQRFTIVTESVFGPSSNELDRYLRRLEEISAPSLKYLSIQALMSSIYVRVRIKSPSNFEKFTPGDCWKPPSSVPTCLLSTLQTLEWREYTGTCAEKEVVSYLLKHALCLKTAKIITESCALFKKMKKDLLSMPRGSTTCRLVLKIVLKQ
ncbi:hypothetical protein N665_0197s0050 [Sinapis alba]|nr:hypothetical protein N665_0197s0050 [Sinapis alba]